MPTKTEYVDPEKFFEHNEIEIFYTYKDDDVDQGTNTDFFTFDVVPEDGEEDLIEFDVRELPLYETIVGSKRPEFLRTGVDSPREKKAKELLWRAWHDTSFAGDPDHELGVESLLIQELIARSLDNGDLKIPQMARSVEAEEE